MKSNAFLPTLLLMALANTGCAKESEPAKNSTPAAPLSEVQATTQKPSASNNTIRTQHLDKRALLVTSTEQADIASLFSVKPASADTMVIWITRILDDQGASEAFTKKLSARLKMNPRLQKDTFSLPIIDEQGKEHLFELKSDNETRFYTLNYRGTASNGE